MTNHAVVPLIDMPKRMPEHGRIRLGVQTEKAMKSIDTFRFTSPDQEAIKQLAEAYGGTARPWTNPRANPQSQFEVITKAAEVRVYLPADALSVFYEQWTGGGCAKRCDGITCETAQGDGMVEVPCPCAVPRPPRFPEGRMECKPYTRLTVVLPNIRFGGGWRLETKGWNAAHEMPGMVQMIHEVQGRGLTEARLRLDKESTMKNGKRSHFVVPRLLIPETPLAMIEGAGQVRSLGVGSTPALPAATTPEEREASEPLQVTPATEAPPGDWFDPDDEPADAVLVDPEGNVIPPEGDDDADDAAALLDAFPDSELVPVDTEHAGDGDVVAPPTRRRAANPQLAKLVLDCNSLGDSLQATGKVEANGTDDVGTELRHAIAWYASKKATESSSKLDKDGLSKAIDTLVRCEENPGWLVQLLKKFREREM